MLGSNPYVCRSYGGKTDSGAFLPGGPNLFKTFIKVKYTLSGKISLRKLFCHLANISSLFADENFFLR